jgi:hypothetical protein
MLREDDLVTLNPQPISLGEIGGTIVDGGSFRID